MCVARSGSWLVVIVGVLLAGEGWAEDAKSHLLLTLEVTPKGSRVVDAKRVAGPMQKWRHSQRKAWRVEVRDQAQKALFSEELPPADELRVEFLGAEHDHKHVRQSSYVFTVRVPELPNAKSLAVLSVPPAGSTSGVSARALSSTAQNTEIATFSLPAVIQ